MGALTTLFFNIPWPWFWLIATVLFTILEGLTLGITSIWFAVGALITMICSFFIPSFIFQLFIFIISSLLLVATTRKVVVEKLRVGYAKTNVDELIGKEAVVVKEILPYEAGEVKLDGKVWRAISESQSTYQEGIVVSVLKIEGVTVIIK